MVACLSRLPVASGRGRSGLEEFSDEKVWEDSLADTPLPSLN
jgi:hypothetical protein